jgi:hypothetical protein
MTRKPTAPPPPERSQADRQDEPHPQSAHYGELAIARHHKDDGRALILYTRIEPEPT